MNRNNKNGHTPNERSVAFFMEKNKEKKINLEELTEEELIKYEIAEELGLLDRVLEEGWRTLTAKETGRIGGLVTKRKREKNK